MNIPGHTPDIYATEYDALLKHLSKEGCEFNWSSILEVGTSRGDGALFLREAFPRAEIETIDRPEPFSAHAVEVDKVIELLKRINVKYHRLISPPSLAWNKSYDFCCIDISSRAMDNIQSFSYWRDYMNEGGILAMVIPKSTPEKLLEREKFSEFLGEESQSFTTYNQFFIFKF